MVNLLKSYPRDDLPKNATLQKVVSYLHGLKITDEKGKQENLPLRYFFNHPEEIDKVADKLEAKGFSRFDVIGMGAFSLVMDIGANQVLRLTLDRSVSKEAKSWKHP